MNRHESEVIPIKTPVSRVGNKTSILHILYALFPLNYGRFIDVFGGSGSVLLGNPTVSSFEVYTILDGLKNRPMEYDEQIVRQLLECITVDSKEQITVIFVGGLKVVQPLID